jgi:hypothetical protein
MNLGFKKTEIFAFIILLFANFILADAQNIYELPAGTIMRVQMDNEINSKVASVNDTFTATLAAPVRIQETVLLPIGTVIEGRITRVKRTSFGGKSGSLGVSFQTLRLLNGTKLEIEGVLIDELKTESSGVASALAVLGGTAIGGIVGAVSKVENGALIGAGIGAATGTGFAFLRKGKDVSIKAGEEFEIKLTRTVNLPVQDF